MKRFDFRLQSVLDYRRQVEEQQNLLFGRVLRMAEAQREELETLLILAEQVRDEMRNCSTRQLNVEELRQHRLYLDSVRTQANVVRGRLENLKRELDDSRVRLIEARRERKTLEHLHDKRKGEHQYEVDREEQREVDEVAGRVVVHRPAAF